MIGSRRRPGCLRCLAVIALFLADVPRQAVADGFFSNVREDVRSTESAPPPPPSPPREESRHERKRRSDHGYENGEHSFSEIVGLGAMFTMGTAWVVTSPFWGPAAAAGDTYDADAYFADFPYADQHEGRMVFSRATCDCGALLDESGEPPEHAPYCAWHFGSSKAFSGRLTGEWAEQPGDVSRIGGRLQLSTSSRFGLDTQMDWLREPASGPFDDELWLGDCNVVFRFAQSERVQFYSGIGFNWLDDPIDTDFGFNFTYGADFFPAKPWVISSSIDWGSLGRAEQFRFRTTAGLMINRVEVFTGYEYLDIDRTQMNTYVAGVGIWF